MLKSSRADRIISYTRTRRASWYKNVLQFSWLGALRLLSMVDRVSSFLPTSRKRVLLFTAVLLCTACEVSQSTPDEGKRTFSNGKAEGGEQTLLEGEQELDSGCFPVTSYAGTALFDADDMREVAEAKQPLYNKLDMRGLLPRVTASNAGLLWRTNGMWTFVLPNQPPLPGRGAPPAHLAMSFLERTARWGPAALKVALLTQHNDAWCWFAPEAVLNFTTQSVDLAAHDWSGQTWDEDARLFSMNNGSFLGMSYSSVSVECKSDPTCKENVGGVRVATATLAVASDGVRLEVMRRDLFPPLGDSKFEKNWGFFPCSEAPDGACVVLRVQPLVVVANPSIDGPKGATLRHEVGSAALATISNARDTL